MKIRFSGFCQWPCSVAGNGDLEGLDQVFPGGGSPDLAVDFLKRIDFDPVPLGAWILRFLVGAFG